MTIVDHSSNPLLSSTSSPAPVPKMTMNASEEYQAFIYDVTETVRNCLHQYFNNPGAPTGQYRIVNDKEFTDLCRDFSRKYREELRSSHIAFRGDLAGISLTPDHKMYIRGQIDFQLEMRQQNRDIMRY